MAKRKKPGIATLKKKLDLIFGKFIRLRDKDHTGWAVCCTCNRAISDGNVNAGHWISRGFLPTRFDEHNVHAQCVHCNNWLGGRCDDHERFISNKYGSDEVNRLRDLKLTPNFKYSIEDYLGMIALYKEKYKDLVKEKGIE